MLAEAEKVPNLFTIEGFLRAQAKDVFSREETATVSDPKLAFGYDRYGILIRDYNF